MCVSLLDGVLKLLDALFCFSFLALPVRVLVWVKSRDHPYCVKCTDKPLKAFFISATAIFSC